MHRKIERLLVIVLLLVSSLVFGQISPQKQTKGVVEDENGTALQGIAITERGTSNAVTTNKNGIIVTEAHQDDSRRRNSKSVVTSDGTPWLNTQVDVSFNNITSAQSFNQAGVASNFFQQISKSTSNLEASL